jgi:selenium-binding protein 1
MVKANVNPDGGMELDKEFFLESDAMRTHQVRLEGDASSDSLTHYS